MTNSTHGHGYVDKSDQRERERQMESLWGGLCLTGGPTKASIGDDDDDDDDDDGDTYCIGQVVLHLSAEA